MSEKKVWVETIIDAFDLETTKEIARKAVEFGTDWISVGTNNVCLRFYAFDSRRQRDCGRYSSSSGY